ncbi:MAG: acyl-CoA synthetase (AMP-forming)/AMP-acid ligase [Deltaproteobacteria bacterium]|nr:acyl-CoA synthetase (AMP-forming)/AMP-acid ligase [Deltaproteobacteria bacterium]
MEFNVADLVEAAVDRVPEREALVCGSDRLTYAQLDQRANRLAHFLQSRGFGRGDHIGIYGFNSARWVESCLAAYKIRAVPINVNYRYVEEELLYLFDNADLVALVHDAQFAPRIANVRSQAPQLRLCIAIDDGSGQDCAVIGSVPYEHAAAEGSPARDFGPRSGDDLYILYTGGTTGKPKGVMWRQQDVIFTLGGGIDHTTNEPAATPEVLTNKIMPAFYLTTAPLAPLMHGAAQWTVLGPLFTGARVVLSSGRFDPHQVWRMIERERVNTLALTGDAMARPLIEALSEPGVSYDLSSLMVITSTAAVFSPSVQAQYVERFPNVMLIEATGSSEQGSTGMHTITKEGLTQTGTRQHGVRIKPGKDVMVFDEDLQPVPPGSGVVGKLARGGNIPLGYYKDPEKSAETFVEIAGERWSIPGDYAIVEADGTVVMLGRGSVSINSGGEKIYPEEVEGALKSHPAVFDALVVGVPDERWGSRVAAVVQPRPGQKPTLDELAAHCRARIAGYKIPRELHLVGQVVRAPSGKPDYRWAQQTALTGQYRA